MLARTLELIAFCFTDGSKCFGFIIRDITNEKQNATCCFQFKKNQSVKLEDILRLIAKQISKRGCSENPDDFIVKDIPPGRLSVQIIKGSGRKQDATKSSVLSFFKNRLFRNKNKLCAEDGIRLLRKSVSCSDLNTL